MQCLVTGDTSPDAGGGEWRPERRKSTRRISDPIGMKDCKLLTVYIPLSVRRCAAPCLPRIAADELPIRTPHGAPRSGNALRSTQLHVSERSQKNVQLPCIHSCCAGLCAKGALCGVRLRCGMQLRCMLYCVRKLNCKPAVCLLRI